MSDGKTERSRRRTVLRGILVWGGTIALLTYLGLTTNLAEVGRALALTNPLLLILVTLGFTALTFVTDVSGMHILLRLSGFSVPAFDLFRIKGTSYLLNILNYNLALAMMAAALSRHAKKGIGTAGSPFVFLLFVDLCALSMQALAGLWFAGSPFPAEPTWILLFVCAGGLLSPFVLWGVARIQNAPGWMSRILDHSLWSSFRAIGLSGIFLLLGVRALLLMAYLVMNFCFLRVFDIGVPFERMLVYSPILSLVGFIPISISGIGSTQVVMRFFYAAYVPVGLDAVATVDACSTVALLSVLMVRIGISLVCMPSVSRMMAGCLPDDSGV